MTKKYNCYKNVLRFRENRTYRVLESTRRNGEIEYTVFYSNDTGETFTKAKLDRHFKIA